ncbi:hypothetical protein SprV_0200758700 [Sparganum proliferum]
MCLCPVVRSCVQDTDYRAGVSRLHHEAAKGHVVVNEWYRNENSECVYATFLADSKQGEEHIHRDTESFDEKNTQIPSL